MAEYKQVDLQIGTEAQFESKKENLPIGTIVGITDPIHKSELDSDLQVSIDSIADKLDKPSGNPTEDSLIVVSSAGSISYQPLAGFGLVKYKAVTIDWANVSRDGFTDTVRKIENTINMYEHSLYIRLVYGDWNAEVFLTVASGESSEVTSLTTLLGSTYYHEASGTIRKAVGEDNYYLGQIQNVSNYGVEVLIPV